MRPMIRKFSVQKGDNMSISDVANCTCDILVAEISAVSHDSILIAEISAPSSNQVET